MMALLRFYDASLADLAREIERGDDLRRSNVLAGRKAPEPREGLTQTAARRAKPRTL